MGLIKQVCGVMCTREPKKKKNVAEGSELLLDEVLKNHLLFFLVRLLRPLQDS